MIKFAVKVGLATAAVYYIKEQNVWRSSNESVQALEKFKAVCKPYVQEIKSQIPVELPELPETTEVSSLAREGWNKGVLVTFNFLANLPEKISDWSAKGIEALQQSELKNALNLTESNKEK